MTRAKTKKSVAVGNRAFKSVCAGIKLLRNNESAVLELLRNHSQQLAERVYGPRGQMTMRGAARRVGLSPAYLSQVMHGRPLSPSAFLRLSELLEEQ